MTTRGVPSEVLCRHAEKVQAGLADQDAAWSRGFTRRRMLQGVGMAGVAALASQLVTTRVAYAASAASTGNTLVVVFLRGGADGLRMLIPQGDLLGGGYLRSVRGPLVPANADIRALAGTSGWGVNKGFDSLLPLWATGELAFVPAVSAAGVTRSHFQAQQVLERGGPSSTTGWLDRTLQALGPGTTFRALAEGSAMPASFAGNQQKLGMSSLAAFNFPGWDGVKPQSMAAISSLYRGFAGALAEDVTTTLSAIGTAQKANASAGPQHGAVYPKGGFASSLADLATLLRSEVGVEVATVDVGGWDTHTDEAGDLDALTRSASDALAAFMTDLGPARRKRVTVAVMTEFGRRVQINASNGTDHGTGSTMFLLGGGLARASVFGKWTPLSAATLADGDVPSVNNAYDVLGELIQKRLSVGSLATIFPGHRFASLGLARAT
ncbi:Uncharacterized conserved protein, DUF1501 family [Nakamurella panacisegetis]|uniref:Uncharacterized conserved protein, DUF1501 family n=1 Tax=Nakamurella panacisegetis TaxID=1090615 RepID=A0A1H0HLY7_9ACTN|nr:DUF1501 domain-containing protein [Nakamurella panacisegetis]SDO19831.1 Uncharacterized conserved protein, DUF1501 family [Nakamurella panacisegetis]